MKRFEEKVKRVVIKVGTSSITHKNGTVDLSKIEDLSWAIADLKNHGVEVILVSSAAISCGTKFLGLEERPRDTIGKQATSAVGQVVLMNTYKKAMNDFGYNIAQLLITRQIETDPIMYENTINVFEKLLDMDVVPIVNENDTISTEEIEYGDNDTLSAVVARFIHADLLIILSDIDGLYDDDPHRNPDAKLITEVNEFDQSLFQIAKGSNTKVGTGGMVTKINACRLCLDQYIDVVIASGEDMNIIRRIVDGEEIGTIFRKRRTEC